MKHVKVPPVRHATLIRKAKCLDKLIENFFYGPSLTFRYREGTSIAEIDGDVLRAIRDLYPEQGIDDSAPGALVGEDNCACGGGNFSGHDLHCPEEYARRNRK